MTAILMVLLACDVGAAAPRIGTEGITVRPYLAVDEKEVSADDCRLDRSDAKISVTFRAPRDGPYRFGLAIEGKQIAPLAPSMPQYTAQTLKTTTIFRYPYDWADVGQHNVLSMPRLVMPGIKAGGKIYHLDTRELTAITLQPAERGQVRALLLAHRFFNQGWDAASPDLRLKQGETRTLDVLVFKDVDAVNRARFGTALGLDAKQLAAVFYRGWTTPQFKAREYDKIADRLKVAFDFVMIREADEHGWIPSLFHKQGIKVMDYQYLGALRLDSAQMTKEIQEKFGLKGLDGSYLTSPKPTQPEGHWQLLDIRRPEVRAMFVANAVKAVRDGFDAVFVDGYIFWRDASGHIGGNVPAAEHSLAHSRWQTLSELREAIHKANPRARLGVLGNRYYDTLGAADFILKERMYGVWERDGFTKRFDKRKVRIGQNMDVSYEEGESPYVAKDIVYGFKGISPVCVQSAKHFLRHPRGPFYITTEDFLPEQLDEWLNTQRAIATQDDLYINKIEPPSVEIHFEGKSTLWAEDSCSLEFSKPVRIVLKGEKLHTEPATAWKLKPKTEYVLEQQ